MSDLETVLEIRDLSVAFLSDFEQVEAVRAINLDLRHGEILAIVGESGSGKSTLAMAIVQLLPMNARIKGQIYRDGVDLLSLDTKEIARWRGNRIATIFQDPASTLDRSFLLVFSLMKSYRLLSQPSQNNNVAFVLLNC